MSTPHAVPVSLAEIARIAGVGRAAVSNWRRRHDSFPTRIGGTDVSPQFSLAEVELWLRDNGKLKDNGDREFLWPRFEALGSRDESGLAVAEAARRMRTPRTRASHSELSPGARELADEAAKLGRNEGPRETFEFLLQRWLETHVRQLSTTPEARHADGTDRPLCPSGPTRRRIDRLRSRLRYRASARRGSTGIRRLGPGALRM